MPYQVKKVGKYWKPSEKSFYDDFMSGNYKTGGFHDNHNLFINPAISNAVLAESNGGKHSVEFSDDFVAINDFSDLKNGKFLEVVTPYTPSCNICDISCENECANYNSVAETCLNVNLTAYNFSTKITDSDLLETMKRYNCKSCDKCRAVYYVPDWGNQGGESGWSGISPYSVRNESELLPFQCIDLSISPPPPPVYIIPFSENFDALTLGPFVSSSEKDGDMTDWTAIPPAQWTVTKNSNH